MPPRRPRTSAGLRLFSRLLQGGARSRKGKAPGGLGALGGLGARSSSALAGAGGSSRRGGRSSLGRAAARRPGDGRWQRRLRGTVRIVLLMAVLGALNLYVLYYRRGTSVPELIKAAEVGRQASLLPGLEGPPGTPPRMAPKRPERAAGLRGDFGRVIEIKGSEEEHLTEVLARAGVKGKDAADLQKALSEGSDGHLLPGQRLVLFYDLEDRLQAVDYDREEEGLRVERTQVGSAEHWTRTELPGAVAVHATTVAGTLARDGGLQDALQRAGEARPLGGLICDALAYDLDLPAGGKAGDRFKVVVEKVYRGGQFYRYGQVLAVQWEGGAGQRDVRAVLYRAPGQAPAYYTPEGEDLRRALLRSPLRLAAQPVVRGVALARPALHHEGKKLLGADLPAPAGAAVRALAAGKVTFRGVRPALGQTVVLGHGQTETTYARLGRLARGLAEGQSVRAGQVIGYVAAGEKGKPAHLHLAVRQGGKVVDPLKLQTPRGATLPASDRTALEPLLQKLDGREIAAR